MSNDHAPDKFLSQSFECEQETVTCSPMICVCVCWLLILLFSREDFLRIPELAINPLSDRIVQAFFVQSGDDSTVS